MREPPDSIRGASAPHLIFCKNRLALTGFSLTSRRSMSLLSQLMSTPLFFSTQGSAAHAGVRSGKRNLTVRLCAIPFSPLPSPFPHTHDFPSINILSFVGTIKNCREEGKSIHVL